MNISARKQLKTYEYLSSTISKFQALFPKIRAPFVMSTFLPRFELVLTHFQAQSGHAYQEADVATNHLLAGVKFPLSGTEESPVFKAKCQGERWIYSSIS